ncbi:MAG: AAA-associated domain-containing protein [Anaerolineae bacterium]
MGQAFVDASILGRKELFAGRIRRIPLIQWISGMLSADNDHRIEWDVFEAALVLEFSREEATRQLDTALDWGRYAELFSYDKDTESLVIDEEPSLEGVN